MKRLYIRLVLSLVAAAAAIYLASSFRPAGPKPAIVIKTLQVINITTTSADCIFSVEDPQHLPKTLGVCVGKGVNPTTANTKFGLAKAGQGPVKYRSAITGLMAGATMHVRAYAIVSGNTIYGNDISFTTLKPKK
ncbi:MAG: hypothetical protein HYZ15_04920 [Sphingobacteriales bacterium]|nr:hypothetical protein [Sphingobacteriales bacterium]